MTTLTRVRDGFTYAGDTELKVMTCPICGVTYALPARLQENAYARGGRKITWFCCNGHELGYNGPGEDEQARKRAEEALKRARNQAQAERELREDTERRLSAQKGQTTKARKRAAAALCPCCNRSFVQLRRHMENKHPDYEPEKGRLTRRSSV